MKKSELNEKTAIHCKTKEEFDRIYKIFGLPQEHRDIIAWEFYYADTVLYPFEEKFGDVNGYAKENGYYIVNSEEVSDDELIKIRKPINLNRPDLSFITKQKFNNFYERASFFQESSTGEKMLMARIDLVLPELIQIAEMYFDEKKSNPESLVFKMVSKVLNDIKPE